MSPSASILEAKRLAGLAERSGLGDSQWAYVYRNDWLVFSRRTSVPSGQESLALHARWRGPFKVVHRDGHLEERAEFFLPQTPGTGLDPTVDEEVNGAHEEMVSGLLCRVVNFDRGTPAAGEVPSARDLASWLRDAGREAIIDESQNLRLVLKRRGADGQVRVERGEDSLRLVMRVGGWKKIPAPAREAMLLLARQANSMTRLTRIVWTENESSTRCEAVCDLSGLPMSEGVGQLFFKSMLSMAVSGLELALRQLGLELAVLARPEGEEVVKLLIS